MFLPICLISSSLIGGLRLCLVSLDSILSLDFLQGNVRRFLESRTSEVHRFTNDRSVGMLQ